MKDLILDLVRTMAEPGVGLVMLVENVFPPLPSEMIMPLAGYLAALDEMSFVLALALGSLGALVGTLGWFWAGRRMGAEALEAWLERRGLWIGLQPRDVARAERWFERHGGVTVFFARLIPGVRTVISIPAGLSDMSFWPFLAYTVGGILAWNAALAYAGYFLGIHFDQVDDWIGPVVWLIVGAAAVLYVSRVGRALWRRRAASSASRGPSS